MTEHFHRAEYLPYSRFQELIDLLRQEGYTCIGPQVREHAIHYDTLSHVDSLPRGMSDEQTPGNYRLKAAGHERYFAWANGPQALKPHMFSPHEALWESVQDDEGNLKFYQRLPENRKLAVIGVRACDLSALYIHDKHFLQHGYRDPGYLIRRQDNLLIAVNCTHPAETCFCVSTGDGPEASFGYDIVMTELDDGFVIQSHTGKGEAIQTKLNLSEAFSEQTEQAEQLLQQARQKQTRSLPSRNLNASLKKNLQHPRWQEVATRCLSCANCTSVCPTCFCHSEEDEPSLDGTKTVHFKLWDSCFSQGHSYIHGLTIRPETDLRYRQWMTHKLGTWHEQFGRSGCVGCGRCITWCPVGIDITEEANVICAEEKHA